MDSSDTKPFEKIAEEKKTPAWLLAGMKAYKNWPAGREVSESEFDQVAVEVANLPIG